jgi:hypothetical protein
MNKSAILKLVLLFAVLSSGTASSIMGQPYQYSDNMVDQIGQYSADTPMPASPTTPEYLGLQMPSAITSQQAPTMQEKSQGLIATNQQSAYVAATQGLTATATSSTYARMIVPTGTYAPNSLYVFSAPQTTVGCYLYANLPLWMKTASSGNVWFYEWYADGMLNAQHAGYVSYPGWYKQWFYADVPGWHVLQYYCNGWSNYIYIYVYGHYVPGSGSTGAPAEQSYVPPSSSSAISQLSSAGLGTYTVAVDQNNRIVSVTLSDGATLNVNDLAQRAADKSIKICNILFTDRNIDAVVVIQLANIGGELKPGVTIRIDRGNWNNIRNHYIYDWRELKTMVNYWYMPPEQLVKL